MLYRPWIVALALGLAAPVVRAGPPEDFKAGLDAYRVGDVRTAVSILRNSADGGHAASQVLLGDILDAAEEDEEAVKYYRLAAEQGSADGYMGLAKMYSSGEGVAKDVAAARGWILKAAETGHPVAVQALAKSYIEGGLGLTDADRSGPQALRWIQAGAALDLLPAIDRLAVAYRQGQLGLAADAARASELEARALKLRTANQPAPGKGKGRAKPKAPTATSTNG